MPRRQSRLRSDGGGLMNTLVGITEIAKRLRLSRQRAHVLATSDDFPRPVEGLARGRVWKAADVERWIAENPQYDHAQGYDR
jgi:prophage regulatory protein